MDERQALYGAGVAAARDSRFASSNLAQTPSVKSSSSSKARPRRPQPGTTTRISQADVKRLDALCVARPLDRLKLARCVAVHDAPRAARIACDAASQPFGPGGVRRLPAVALAAFALQPADAAAVLDLCSAVANKEQLCRRACVWHCAHFSQRPTTVSIQNSVGV